MANQKVNKQSNQQSENFGTMDTKQNPQQDRTGKSTQNNGPYENQKQGQISSNGASGTTQS